MTLQATAIFFDSNQPFLLERGKPGAFKQMALENALSCRNVSPIYGKHTTLGYAVCGVDHTVSLILVRSSLLVSIIRVAAFHQVKQPQFAVCRPAQGMHTLWYGDFWAKITTLTGRP